MQQKIIALFFLSSAVSASQFVQQQVQLQHPANGDMLFMPQAKVILQSGHSETERWLSWVDVPALQAKLVPVPQDALFFQQAKLVGHGQESLVMLGTEGISRYEPGTNHWLPLTTASSIYRAVDEKRLPALEFVLDLNGDQLSDFLVPDFQHYHVYLQQLNGGFQQFDLPVNSRMRVFQQQPEYSVKKPYVLDFNQDGRNDLAFAQDDQLLIYLQTESGFSSQATVVSLGLALTPDVQAELRGGDGRSFKGLQIRRLFDIKDLNNDGLADIVVRQERFNDAVEQNYSYSIHYARANDGYLLWPAEAIGKIDTQGIQSEPQFADLNGDNKLDFYTPAAEFGIGTIVRALLAGTASMDLLFYPQQADGQYPKRPVYRQEATAQVSIGNGKVNMPVLKVLSSPNQPAVLVIGDDNKLKLFDQAEGKLFSSKSSKLKQAVPLDGMDAQTADLDGNGKMDLILPFSQQDPAAVRNQLHLLLQM